MRFDGFKIKRLLSLFLIMMAHTTLSAQSPSKNYVQTKTFLDTGGTTFLRHIDYYDELGFVAETVDVGVNTSQTPIVTRTEYDTRLKPSYVWAPVPASGLDYIDNVYDKAHNTYNSTFAYATNEYDDFQELSSCWKSGDAWEERPVTISRHVVPAGEVRKYSVDDSGNLSDDGTYPYGMLTSATTTDEDGRSVTVYTNMHGNTVLERRGTGDNATDTYYVYDAYGRLGYVLPPMCQHCDASEMPKFWYKYTYDDRGRCTEKLQPGCDAVKYWYDEANRIQSEQDGHLRAQSLYRNYSYDGIGRLVLQTVSPTRGEASEASARVVEVKNYYDGYASCRAELSQVFAVWADSINARQTLPTVARGRLTATLHTTGDGKRFFELYYYDDKGRVACKLSAYGDSWLKSVHTSYNFIGDVVSVLESVYTHEGYGKLLLARRRTANAYHTGTRLLASTTVTHTDKDNNAVSQVTSRPSYDVFGNTVADDRPGTAADMAYTYDTLHGWLKGISSPCGFSEQLQRETAAGAQFSGNIGGIRWRNAVGGELHGYDYTYDALGRLTDALYSSSTDGREGRYDEQVAYNPNGSITSLLRNGMRNDGTFGAIDDLAIDYDGNRLLKVTDGAETVNYNGALDFDDGDDADCEYQYDSGGALTYDGNRGITSITYDYGHHPSSIVLSTKKKGVYNDYTPDGRKLSSRHLAYVPNGNGGSRRITSVDLYVDGLVLRGGKPLMWLFNGGYVDLDDNGTPTGWNYYVTDHLGSTRMVVGSDNSIKETINYYPFGSEMRMEDPAQMTGEFLQPYRFTGKELDRVNGLNMYDFGARWYDVAGVPMWTSVDPLAEKYYHISPYAYCGGNPVMLVDPDGREVFADCLAIRNIGNTLSEEESQYVRFDECGKLDVDLMNQYKGTSANYTALLALANSKTKYIFAVSDCDINGEKFYERGTQKEAPNNYRYGVTNMPGMEEDPSPDNNVYIYTASFLSPKIQARNTAHEGYGHAYFYELHKTDSSLNPNHTFGVIEYFKEMDPEWGPLVYPIFGKNNTKLEEQINIVEEQAIMNYERKNP